MATKLNIDAARTLMQALRSGEFEQGKHSMKTTDGRFCCLGVAHECLIGPLVPSDLENNITLSARLQETDQPEYFAVCKALGIPPEMRYTLAGFNDRVDKPFSFNEIAAFIEGLVVAQQVFFGEAE